MLTTRLLDPLAPPLCFGCGGYAGRAEPLCAACRRALPYLGPEPARAGRVPVWAPLAYRGPARALVTALKFRGAGRLAAVMAAQIVAGVPPGWLAGAALVPVPLHRSRRRRRGYNQAELIARGLVERTGAGFSNCLERSGRSVSQVGRGRTERMLATEGVVAVRQDALVPGRALLVDDVVTTGATLAACARALHGTGARSVRAVAYARTPAR